MNLLDTMSGSIKMGIVWISPGPTYLMFQVSSLIPLAFRLPDLSLSTYQMLGPQLTPTLCISRSLPSRGAGFRIWATLADPLLLTAHWGSGYLFPVPSTAESLLVSSLSVTDHCNSWSPWGSCFLSQCCLKLFAISVSSFLWFPLFLFHGRLWKSSSLGGSRER